VGIHHFTGKQLPASASCSQQQLFLRQLPNSVANLSSIFQGLYLGDNMISGNILINIGSLVCLTILEMANTFVSGLIPESIGQLSNLVDLGLVN
jgi:hypothetical protein